MSDQAIQPEANEPAIGAGREDEPLGRIGGGWKLSAALLPGEVVEKMADVLHRPSITNKGGLLYLTNKRVLYLPDRWSAICGEQRLTADHSALESFGMLSNLNGPLFRDGNLLAFHGFYITFRGKRHVFTTRLRMTDQEWVDAIAAAGDRAPENERGD